MNDLVKQLRIKAGVIEMGERISFGSETSLMFKAADEIEKLKNDISVMIQKAASKNLPAYREQSQKMLAAIEENEKQAKRIAELEQERDEYHSMVVYTGMIMEESEGVAGYHLNGDLAPWDELFTSPEYKSALAIRDLEQQALGVESASQYALNKFPNGAIHSMAEYANKLREKAEALRG
ncbi:hypothetical protein ACFO4O_04120 [Glaciecola siphonariae]|uniref:Phage protein n=1 Tax=Glaciecola siphonariae TaxID=521012 RepID=A0ABV9LTL8_9ALTE